jgi:hypothetical protein
MLCGEFAHVADTGKSLDQYWLVEVGIGDGLDVVFVHTA